MFPILGRFFVNFMRDVNQLIFVFIWFSFGTFLGTESCQFVNKTAHFWKISNFNDKYGFRSVSISNFTFIILNLRSISIWYVNSIHFWKGINLFISISSFSQKYACKICHRFELNSKSYLGVPFASLNQFELGLNLGFEIM